MREVKGDAIRYSLGLPALKTEFVEYAEMGGTYSFYHLMNPTDNATGKITGTRMHSSMLIIKEFDCSSPYLYKAVATGQSLVSAEIKWYRINYQGQEEEYFNMLLEGVRVVSISPAMAPGDNPNENHMETVELRYEKITWKHNDGNIIFSDAWNERQSA